MDHHVDVRITDGFARTSIQQTFSNPNQENVEAIYAFPVPQHSSLSEITIWSGETVLRGEVVSKEEAKKIYEEEKSKGNDAGLASKENYQRYEFRIFPVRPGVETRIEVVYYQPLSIDLGIGRYHYPIEEGGTDEEELSFWTQNSKVERNFSAKITVRSGYPIDDIRVPGFNNGSNLAKTAEDTWQWEYQSQSGTLNKDLILYYRLQENLPGRLDLITNKNTNEAGYFLMTLTPGIDLAPITSGADYVFVLDVSGSMGGKISTLTQGVIKALGKLSDHDRVRIVTFSNSAQFLIADWTPLTDSNIGKIEQQIQSLSASGGTNIYAGLQLGFQNLDQDRPTNVILVTDGVTNQGIVDPRKFHELTKSVDIRMFGFLMGNSANWPLMQVICDGADGFYTSVSNADDITGKILQAKEKIVYESLHNVEVKIDGINATDISKDFTGKIFRGQQLSIFGRYQKGGKARVTLTAHKTGENLQYETTVDFPNVDQKFPELERLWAMSSIESIQLREALGYIPQGESSTAIRDLGIAYQIVTDETSMIVLSDESHTRHGVSSANRDRIQREQQAQSQRAQTPAPSTRADNGQAGQPNQPMFPGQAPRIYRGGGGGGALGAEAVIFTVLSGLGVWWMRRKSIRSN